MYYTLPKKYNYHFKYLDNNQGLNFLKEQLDKLNFFNLEILTRYKTYFDTSSDNIEAAVISNDIKKFLFELTKVKSSIYKQYNIISKGSRGEDKVRNTIYSFDNEWKIISNARLIVEGNSIENDFILIDESGISTIEVKNIGSYNETLNIDSLGRVIRLNKFNQEIETYDMIFQSNRHLAYLKKFINNKFDYSIPVNSFIVISSNIKVINKSNFKIIGLNQIYDSIKSQDKAIDEQKIEEIYNKLLNNVIDNNKYQYVDCISVLENNYKLILLSIKEYNDNH